jgi:hypothetical protein
MKGCDREDVKLSGEMISHLARDISNQIIRGKCACSLFDHHLCTLFIVSSLDLFCGAE